MLNRINRLHLLQNLIFLSSITLILIVWTTNYFLHRQNIKLQKKQAQLQNQITFTPTPTLVLDETANWETFSNNYFKFSFQYPNNIELQPPDPEVVDETQLNFILKYPEEYVYQGNPDYEELNNRYFSLHFNIKNIANPPSDLTSYKAQQICKGKNMLSQLSGQITECNESTEAKKFKLYSNGSIKGIIGTYTPYEQEITTILFINNDSLYELVLSGAEGAKPSNSALDLMDQILSTFKFLEVAVNKPCNFSSFPFYKERKLLRCIPIDNISISNWKKYKIFDDQRDYGITFSHPEYFVIKDSSRGPEGLSVELDRENGVEDNLPIVNLAATKINQKFADWVKNTYEKECPRSFESCNPLVLGPERGYYQFETRNRHFASIDTYSERNGIVMHIGMSSRKTNEPFNQDELQLYNQIIYSFGYYGP